LLIQKKKIPNQEGQNQDQPLETASVSKSKISEGIDAVFECAFSALLWLFSLLFSIFPLASLPDNDSSTWLLGGGVWIVYIVVGNFFIANLRTNTSVSVAAAIAAIAAILCFLMVIFLGPARISGGIVRELGLGNISNVTLLVTADACKAMNQFDGSLCKVSELGNAGIIPQADIVSRIGGEYLLEFRYPKECPVSCIADNGISRVLRVAVKGEDVISTVIDRPVKSSAVNSPSQKQLSWEPLDTHPHNTLSARETDDFFACHYVSDKCEKFNDVSREPSEKALKKNFQDVSPAEITPQHSSQSVINNYNIIGGDCSCLKKGTSHLPHTEKPCIPQSTSQKYPDAVRPN
jgi:hypothetical protein